MITLTIPGPPVPKARPRVLKTGRTYTPKRTADYEALIKKMFISKYGQTFVPLDCPLSARVRAFCGVPSSWSNKKKLEALAGRIRPTKRPDIDNIIKCLDSLNGIAFKDDSYIVDVQGGKWYSEQPRVEIEISIIGGTTYARM